MKEKPYKLYRGDCLEVMKTFEDNSVDCVITDPPYGETAQDWDSVINFTQMWKELKRVVKKDSPICLFSGGKFSGLLQVSNIKKYKHKWFWWKNRTSNFLNANVQPLNCIEEILTFSYGKCPYFYQKSQGHTPINFARRKADSSDVYGTHKEYSNNVGDTERYPTNILIYNSIDNCSKLRVHSNQKPTELLQYLTKTYSQKNELVLDFTMGSGTTGVACMNEGRKFIGIELDKDYFEIAKARIKRANLEPSDIPNLTKKNSVLPLFDKQI